MSDCLTCELNARGDALPPQERIYLDEHWRVAHGWGSLPGWLVVAARRHVAALDELPAAAGESLGRILYAASATLREAVGCERTYVMLFAEAEGYRHVHVHVVPRMPWFGHEDEGPRVFRHMNAPDDERVPADEQRRLAVAIGDALRARLG